MEASMEVHGNFLCLLEEEETSTSFHYLEHPRPDSVEASQELLIPLQTFTFFHEFPRVILPTSTKFFTEFRYFHQLP